MKVNSINYYRNITEQKWRTFTFKICYHLKNQNVIKNTIELIYISINSTSSIAFLNIKKYMKFFILHLCDKYCIINTSRSYKYRAIIIFINMNKQTPYKENCTWRTRPLHFSSSWVFLFQFIGPSLPEGQVRTERVDKVFLGVI